MVWWILRSEKSEEVNPFFSLGEAKHNPGFSTRPAKMEKDCKWDGFSATREWTAGGEQNVSASQVPVLCLEKRLGCVAAMCCC